MPTVRLLQACLSNKAAGHILFAPFCHCDPRESLRRRSFFVLMIEIDILLCIGQQRCAEVSPFRAKEAGEYARLLSQSLQLDVIQLDLLG